MGDNRSTPGMSFLGHMLAGAAAGTVEHVAMYPVDTIKTRMQALAHPGQQLNSSVYSAMKTAIQRNGLGGLYRGVSAMAFGAGPAHALYFATYEAAKEAYGGNRQGHQVVATALAGATATIVNDAVMTPADVVKQRLQIRGSPYKGLSDCVVGTWRTKGLAAFFRSYPTTLLMNVPFTAIHFAAYESGKKLLHAGDEETLATELIAGGVAGGLAAAATTPLDVAKTRLQTEGVRNAKTYDTVSSVRMMRRIAMEEGSAALWRGLEARVLFHVPSAAVCWATYETVKGVLRVR